MTGPAGGGGGKVTVPGIGSMSKNTLYIAVGGVVLLGGYSYYKKRKNTAAAATTGTVNNIDPATGQPFGSAADAAALASNANYQTATSNPNGSSTATPQPTQQGFTNNAQWSQAAQAYLVSSSGGDAATVGQALGKFIAGSVVTATEKAIILQAIAFEGMPPIAGATGFPPAIRDAPPVPTPAQNSLHRIGVVGQVYSWASQAPRFKTTTQTLQNLNPGLSPSHPIPGGYPLITPPGT